MKKLIIGALCAAAASPVCLPAAAASNLSGNYLITLNAVRPSQYKGATACVTLTDDGSAGWAHSGSWAFDGQTVGSFFVVAGVLTAYSAVDSGNYITFSGKLFNKALTDTAITDVLPSQGGALTGNFIATPGGC